MDAVEIGGDGRGMASSAGAGASAAAGGRVVNITKDGWCLYNAILEGFNGVPGLTTNPDDRRRNARMLAYILGQYMIEYTRSLTEEQRRDDEVLKKWRERIVNHDGSPIEPIQYGYWKQNLRDALLPGCIKIGGQCRDFETDPIVFFGKLHHTTGAAGDALIWGDLEGLRPALQRFVDNMYMSDLEITRELRNIGYNGPISQGFRNIMTALRAHVTIGLEPSNGFINIKPSNTDPVYITKTEIVLLFNGTHYDVLIKSMLTSSIWGGNPIPRLYNLPPFIQAGGRDMTKVPEGLDSNTFATQYFPLVGNGDGAAANAAAATPGRVGSAYNTTAEGAAGTGSTYGGSSYPAAVLGRHIIDANTTTRSAIPQHLAALVPTFAPSMGAPAQVVLPQVTGSEGPDDLLVKAAKTLEIGAKSLLDLHRNPPTPPAVAGAAKTFAGRLRGATGVAAAGVTGALAAARRALRVPPAGRPQVPAAPVVPKPRLPPPSVAVRAPTRRRLPLTQPPPRRAPPALPVSLPSVVAAAAAAVGVSGEKPPRPGWAPTPMEEGIRERCAAMPIPTDDCAQYELDKDIDAVHAFIERHQLTTKDPRMKDYIKDRDSGAFSPADLAAKYPDHDVYVRAEGGRPVKMKVTNPYRAHSYRYQTEVSFADPTGAADLSGDDKRLHKQNVDLLKAIAPASVIADKRFATAILESLWRCSASQDLAGKPACFPARVLGELRLFQKYNDQASRKQLADDVRVFSEWGMVSDIMRQMIHGDVPPVRADAVMVRKGAADAAAAAAAPQAAPAAGAAGISGEAPAVGVSGEPATSAPQAAPAAAATAASGAAAPKPPAAGPAIRAIRRGLAVRAPTQIGALGPRFQHGILPPTTIGAAGMVV